jgi:hypothetical protein
LRLTSPGLRKVIEDNFSEGESAETWTERAARRARQGDKQRFPIKIVESITDSLPPEYYRVGEEVRSVKRDFGHRKGGAPTAPAASADSGQGLQHPSEHDLGQRRGAWKPVPKEAADIDGVSKHLSRADLGQPKGGAAPSPTVPVGVGDLSKHFSQLDLWPTEGEGVLTPTVTTDFRAAIRHLGKVSKWSPDPILSTAAKSLQEYLQ